MTKYIASFAILSGAQLGSRIWPDWQKSSAALLLSSFPIDKRTEESLGQLPWATGQPLCCSTIAMIKYKYRRFGRPLSTVLSTLAWTLVPCVVDWFCRSDDTMESRKNWGSVCVISDQLFFLRPCQQNFVHSIRRTYLHDKHHFFTEDTKLNSE